MSVQVLSGNVEKGRSGVPVTIVGRLRLGYCLQIGEDIVRGPAEISLDRKTALGHLHKFDNIGDIKDWLGIKRVEPRLSPKQRLEKMIQENAEISRMSQNLLNPQPQPGAADAAGGVNVNSVAFKAALQAEIKRMMPELVTMATAQVMAEIDKPSAPAATAPAKPADAAKAK